MLRYIGIIALVVSGLLFGTALLLSPEYKIEQSIIIQARPAAIHPYVNNLKQWPKWMPWQELEPDTVTRYGDLTQGVGASQSWQGRGGNGHLHITASSPDNGIAYDVFFGDETTPSISAVQYKVLDGNSTQVSWSFSGEVHVPIVGGLFALLVTSMSNDMYRKGLQKLKTVVEQGK